MATQSDSSTQSEGDSLISSSQIRKICGSSKSKSPEQSSTTSKSSGIESGAGRESSSALPSQRLSGSSNLPNTKKTVMDYLTDLIRILKKDAAREAQAEIPNPVTLAVLRGKILMAEGLQIFVERNVKDDRLPERQD